MCWQGGRELEHGGMNEVRWAFAVQFVVHGSIIVLTLVVLIAYFDG